MTIYDPWCPCGCGYSSEDMFAYLDVVCGAAEAVNNGEQPPVDEAHRLLCEQRLADLAAHVRTCASCRRLIAREREVRARTAAGCGEAAVPATLQARIRARIRVTTISVRHPSPRL